MNYATAAASAAWGPCVRCHRASARPETPVGAVSRVHARVPTPMQVVPFYAHLQGRPGRPSAGRDRTGSWRGGFLLGALEVRPAPRTAPVALGETSHGPS